MRRLTVFGLIACFGLLLVLPLTGCKNSAAPTKKSDDGGGGIHKDLDKELNGGE